MLAKLMYKQEAHKQMTNVYRLAEKQPKEKKRKKNQAGCNTSTLV